ncbi:MAG TPA: DUF1003 domain-containing protein [Candidatus Rubrimentiphilum sp.]|nr:DUF1003 domain-containing protein [Candidatus Rubrimentiphilum sp.]
MNDTHPHHTPLTSAQVENHPLVDDVNAMHHERLSPIERTCKKIADATGAPLALMLAIVIQVVWVTVGIATRWDPFPFVFLLTVSNVIQLILIFVISVAQKQQSQHDEIRAEADHDSISRLLYHQQFQDQILLRLAERTGCDVSDLQATVKTLLAPATA